MKKYHLWERITTRWSQSTCFMEFIKSIFIWKSCTHGQYQMLIQLSTTTTTRNGDAHVNAFRGNVYRIWSQVISAFQIIIIIMEKWRCCHMKFVFMGGNFKILRVKTFVTDIKRFFNYKRKKSCGFVLLFIFSTLILWWFYCIIINNMKDYFSFFPDVHSLLSNYLEF